MIEAELMEYSGCCYHMNRNFRIRDEPTGQLQTHALIIKVSEWYYKIMSSNWV